MSAAELREIRERLGWSQSKLARALGVSQQAVSWWESGARRIPGPVAALLPRIESERRAAS